MSRYVLSRDAESDLEQIWDYIAQDDLNAADQWIDRLFSNFERLAANPGLGHTRTDLTDLPLLFWPVGAYLIVYRTGEDGVEIIGVTQGSRDIPSFLSRPL